ncbi:MAG TPA: hemerythrin domain-containing protein [Pseudomonas xinjiangensis]|uniref:Hemerythrin domain-containing protein n=2 Tax=root TaxID=1 RepID=A0A7V1BN26_9GAMM|nr:hemerythrin domain-containing protein [Halopseudomonas xinjiangensis]HEC48005.1 hemerythrin domain-containing protein [Halopseudomonas xinjiangensis]
MNAIDMLKEDHQKVLKLLEDITDTTERAVKKRTELLSQIETELKIHTTIEEEDFYPAYKQAGSKSETKMYHEAIEEHRAVEALVLPDLLTTDPGTLQFSGRVKVLKELLEHHIEEEESEMFTEAAELLSKDELNVLGEQMAAKKKSLKAANK